MNRSPVDAASKIDAFKVGLRTLEQFLILVCLGFYGRRADVKRLGTKSYCQRKRSRQQMK